MKKAFFVAVLVMLIMGLASGVALAGGWTNVNYNKSHDPNDLTGPTGIAGADGEAIWNPDEAPATENQRSPHGNFASTTNRCRVCHAVHGAGAASWRLLRSGETSGGVGYGIDRLTECNYCHGPAGVTSKRPFRPKAYDVRGEHTLGSSVSSANPIPDSNGDYIGGDGLSCGNCHSVHGAGTFKVDEIDGAAVAVNNRWGLKILRKDPIRTRVTVDALGFAPNDTSGINYWGVRSNFCAGCHDWNPNWDTNASNDETNAAYARPNPRSHVQGVADNGLLEVYGETTRVADYAGNPNNSDTVDGESNIGTTARRGCRGCHRATELGNWSNDGVNRITPGTANGIELDTGLLSAFPHQSKGQKFLFDDIDAGTTQAPNFGSKDDANRIIQGMDKVCGKCHTNTGDHSTATQGEGKTF